MAEKKYVPSGPQPTNGQHALDNSVSIKSSVTRSRIGIDLNTGEIVVFDKTNNGTYHGQVRIWHDLTKDMQDALCDNGLIDEDGRVILRDVRGNIIGHGLNVKNDKGYIR